MLVFEKYTANFFPKSIQQSAKIPNFSYLKINSLKTNWDRFKVDKTQIFCFFQVPSNICGFKKVGRQKPTHFRSERVDFSDPIPDSDVNCKISEALI